MARAAETAETVETVEEDVEEDVKEDATVEWLRAAGVVLLMRLIRNS